MKEERDYLKEAFDIADGSTRILAERAHILTLIDHYASLCSIIETKLEGFKGFLTEMNRDLKEINNDEK